MMHSTILVFCGLLLSLSLQAHQSSHSQISLQQKDNVLIGGWHISIDDLERSEGLDINGDGDLLWGEIVENQPLILSIVRTHLKVYQNLNTCDLTASDLMLDNLSTGLYVYVPLKIECPNSISKLKLHYDFLFSFDAQHKAIINIISDKAAQSFVFSETKKQFEYDAYRSNKLQVFGEFVWQGIWHIWIGIDHILFLVSLLLPAALLFNQGRWQDGRSLRLTILYAAKIVTAFTLAHSITLALSVYDLVYLPSRWVESMIAVSVIIAALNNIKPFVHKRLWVLTFAFGLIHGMGFASVLQDVGLPAGLESLALFAFNVGVELGQLAIVALCLPIIIFLSQQQIYRKGVMQFSSLCIVLLAVVWLLERAAEIEIISWI